MSELQFPKNPIVGQEYDFAPYKYYWDGEKWKTKGIDLRGELEPRISNNESKVFEALRRSYAGAGFNLVAGSFEEGGVLSVANDVMITASGAGYTWTGSFPKTVSPGTNPTTDSLWTLVEMKSSGGTAAYPTIANLIAGSPVDGDMVNTVVHNTISNAGGASYDIMTLAEYGDTPDGVFDGTRYIGADYLLNNGLVAKLRIVNGTVHDKAFGVIGKTVDEVLYDDGPALNKLTTYAKKGAAMYGGISGGHRIAITPRSLFYISETIDLLDYFVSLDWGESEMRPTAAIEAIAYESSGTDISGLQIWYDHLDPQTVLEAQRGAFVFSKDRPVALTSESAFSKLSRIWIYNAYQGFRLHSQSPAGGLFWQFAFENCLTWNCFDYGYHLWSVSQVSTTTTLRNCHSKNVTRAIVQHNGVNYAALQTMLPTHPIEPGVTTGWRNYWLALSTFSNTRPEWASGTFYRTCGKGYLIRNVQTVNMDNCSADGSVNYEQGNVLSVYNSNLRVDSFHLEGTNINFADRPPIIIDADMQWGYLYLYDLRIQMENSTDYCSLIGGSLGRQRSAELDFVRNHNQNSSKIGNFNYLRVNSGLGNNDFDRIKVGMGIGPTLIDGRERLAVFTADRLNSRTEDLQFVMAAAGRYYKVYETVVPAVNAATPTYVEFSDLIEVSANAGNTGKAEQQKGVYAKASINVFVQSGTAPNRSYFDVALVGGQTGVLYSTFDTRTRKLALWVKCANNAQNTIVVFKGRNGGYDGTNKQSRMLYSAVEGLAVDVEAMEGFAGVADHGGWIEFIPEGRYTSGSFTIPNGKTFADISELRWTSMFNSKSPKTEHTVIKSSIGSPELYSYPIGGDNHYVRLTGSSSSRSMSVYTTDSNMPLLWAEVKFK